jgi:hypothetical protein
MEARIIIYKDDFEIEVDYNKEFIDDLKRLVPSAARIWTTDRERWLVRKEFREAVKELLRDHFEDVSEVLA